MCVNEIPFCDKATTKTDAEREREKEKEEGKEGDMYTRTQHMATYGVVAPANEELDERALKKIVLDSFARSMVVKPR